MENFSINLKCLSWCAERIAALIPLPESLTNLYVGADRADSEAVAVRSHEC
jgi:hypothetical protein